MTQQQSLHSFVDEFDLDRDGGRPGGGGSNTDWKRLIIGGTALVAAVAALTVLAMRFIGAPPNYAALSRQILVMDAETGEIFDKFQISEGDSEPYEHPRTGERTLYTPEFCYWNSDGSARTEPTYVILGAKLGEQGQTICPDCGRAVVYHNPTPPVEVMMEAFERSSQGRR